MLLRVLWLLVSRCCFSTWGGPYGGTSSLVAHAYLTDEALRLVRKETPLADDKHLRLFQDIPAHNVCKDFDSWKAIKSLVSAEPGIQVPHFIRDEFQKVSEGHKKSTDFMLNEAATAAERLHGLLFWIDTTIPQRREPAVLLLAHPWDLDAVTTVRNMNLPEVNSAQLLRLRQFTDHMAAALHTLQDSYSPGHTSRRTQDVSSPAFDWREARSFDIQNLHDIYAYTHEYEEGVHHHQRDIDYLDKQRTFLDYIRFNPGQARRLPEAEGAVQASVALIRAVLEAADTLDPDGTFRKIAKPLVVDRYLGLDGSVDAKAALQDQKYKKEREQREQQEAEEWKRKNWTWRHHPLP
jgi:hypothetical protein